MIISKDTARGFMLRATGLFEPYQRQTQKNDVLEAIRRMGVLQIDTISVVARSPYLVLWSRLGDYEPTLLDELLADSKLFEQWAHAASFIPIEDFGLFRRFMLDADRSYWKRSTEWIQENQTLAEDMIATIHENGAVMSRDFKRQDGKKSLWWDRKIEKRILEHLYNIGIVMIAERKNFQRVYTLRETLLPGWQDDLCPSTDEVYRQFVLKTVRQLGISLPAWISDYYRLPKRETHAAVDQLLNTDALIEVEVEGWPAKALVTDTDYKDLEIFNQSDLKPNLTTLLSPFDPLIWDRKRTKAVFDFNFALECYLPSNKRKYGYFNLPILYKGKIVGMLDPKAHRKDGIMEIKSIHMHDLDQMDELVPAIAKMLKDFSAWHKTPLIKINNPENSDFSHKVAAILNR